jgi:hypothetical protein
MKNKKLYEFEDDASADKAATSVESSLTKLASAVTNIKDFSRVVEAIAKWLQKKKGSQLSGLDSNQNYKMVMSYLNKMQSDLDDKDKKQVDQTTTKNNI